MAEAWRLIVAAVVVVFGGTATTTVGAASYAYDVQTIARMDVRWHVATEATPDVHVDARQASPSPSVKHWRTSTTPVAGGNATKALPDPVAEAQAAAARLRAGGGKTPTMTSAAVEFTDPLWVDDYSNRVGMPLLPVGYGLNDHLMILVASDGSIYGGFDDFFQRFGEDVPAAIEAIMQEQVSE